MINIVTPMAETRKDISKERERPSYPSTQSYMQPYIQPIAMPDNSIDELFQYVDENDISKVYDYIIEKKLPMEIKNKDGDTLLHVIIRKKPKETKEEHKFDLIRKLFGVQFMSNVPNKSGITPLHLAAKYQYANIIKLLCSVGSVCSPVDMMGMTPLHYAVIGYVVPCQEKQKHNEKTEIQLLLSSVLEEFEEENSTLRKEVKTIYTQEGKECFKSKPETIEILLKYGASVNAQDRNKMTPIFYALQNRDSRTIKLLLEKSATLDAPANFDGLTPGNYFKNLYRNHLNVFSPENPVIKNIDNFSTPYLENLTKFVDAKREFPKASVLKMQESAFIMMSEFLRLYIRSNDDELLKQLLIPEKNPIIQIYSEMKMRENQPWNYEEEKLDLMGKTSNNIIDVYDKILVDTKLKFSKYNNIWKEYLGHLENKKVKIFQTELTEIQLDNPKDISVQRKKYDALGIVYHFIHKMISKYHQEPQDLSKNRILDVMRYIIIISLEKTIGYDFYKKILLIIANQFLEYYRNQKTPNADEITISAINEFNSAKKDVIHRLPLVFSTFILNRQFEESQKHTLQGNLKISFTDELDKEDNYHYPTGTKTEIMKKIQDELSAFYFNAFELSVKCLKNLFEGYFNYLESEMQFVKINKLILDQNK